MILSFIDESGTGIEGSPHPVFCAGSIVDLCDRISGDGCQLDGFEVQIGLGGQGLRTLRSREETCAG